MLVDFHVFGGKPTQFRASYLCVSFLNVKFFKENLRIILVLWTVSNQITYFTFLKMATLARFLLTEIEPPLSVASFVSYSNLLSFQLHIVCLFFLWRSTPNMYIPEKKFFPTNPLAFKFWWTWALIMCFFWHTII